ncbi:MAG: NAD-dependent epimerase/dehydratase family protein [Betaproteobacteria bacterium]
MSKLHVVFGTGPLGLAVMRELRSQGKHVRMVSRSGRVHFDKDAQTEVGGVDASDASQSREACEGATAVYHCIGLPYPRWAEFPSIAAGIVAGASSAGAKLVYADNLYAYGAVDRPMTEDLPLNATTRKGRIRASIAQSLMGLHSAGKLRVAIGRGSDFFGPFATDAAMMGSRVFGRALQGKAAQVVGNPDRLHTYTFIDDFGKALVTLGEHDAALGKAWHVPSAPATTTRGFVEKVYAALGKPARLSAAPRFALALLGKFDDNVKELREMLYQFERNFVMDSGPCEATFGVQPTPLDDSIRQTLDWYRARAST